MTRSGRYSRKARTAQSVQVSEKSQGKTRRTVTITGKTATVEVLKPTGERVTFEIPVGSLDLPESDAARAAASASA